MPDLLYLVVTVAFFAAAAGFVTLCDRIIGPDGDHGSPQGSGEPEPVDASRRSPVAIDSAGDSAIDASTTAVAAGTIR